MEKVKLISGGVHHDERGSLHFNNDVLINQAKRFYQITPKNIGIIRAWQGHKVEQKWFYAAQGSFEISTIEIDSFTQPSNDLTVKSYKVDSDKADVLVVPGGYATGIQSLSENAILLVFSDVSLKQSKEDDYRWEENYFINAKWNR